MVAPFRIWYTRTRDEETCDQISLVNTSSGHPRVWLGMAKASDTVGSATNAYEKWELIYVTSLWLWGGNSFTASRLHVSRVLFLLYLTFSLYDTRGGRGEEWSGDACVALASPMVGRWEAAGEQDARATQGSPPFFPATPAPTRRSRFPARFTKYLPLRGPSPTLGWGLTPSREAR